MLKKILPAIGIILLAYLIYSIGIVNLYNALSNISLYYMAVAIMLTLLYVPMQTLKWHAILKRQGISISFYDAIKMQLKSVFYGIITPARAGSFVKSFYLKDKAGINIGKAISSVLVERMLDLFTIFLLAFGGTLLLTNKLLNIRYAIFMSLAAIIIIGYVVFNRKFAKMLLGFFYNKLLPDKYKEGVRESFYSFYENMPRKTSLIVPFALTVMYWTLTYTITYVIALAFGINIGYFTLIFISAISTFVTLIPITIAGLGTREASLVGLLGIYGINSNSVVAMSLSAFFITGIVPALIGFMFTIKDDSLHKTRQES